MTLQNRIRYAYPDMNQVKETRSKTSDKPESFNYQLRKLYLITRPTHNGPRGAD